MKRLCVLCLLVFLALLSQVAARADPLSLSGETYAQSVGSASSHLADPEGKLDFDEALDLQDEGAFQPVKARHFAAGYSTTPHWLSTEIRNDADEAVAYRILTNLPFVPAISIMMIRADGGREMLLDKRLDTPWRADQFHSLAVATPAFYLGPGETARLMTRFTPYGVGILPMTIETTLSAEKRGGAAAVTRAAFYGFALTSIFMLVLYVFAISRADGASLILSTSSGILLMAQIDGILNAYLWPHAPHWNKIASFPLLMLVCASMLLMARDRFLSVKMGGVARTCSFLALGCLGVLAMMALVDVAQLILVGFLALILSFTMLSYGSVRVVGLIPSRSVVAIAIGVLACIGITISVFIAVTGGGDLGAQNLLNAKITYAAMTVIFIGSYAAQAAGLARVEARFIKRELAQAKAAAAANAALLDAERKYSRAREAEIRQTERLENVSHDLRQPIAALKSTLGPLLEGEDGRGVRSAVDYLDGLISQRLGEASSDQSDAAQIDAEEVAPAALLVNAAAEMFAQRAAEKGIRLRRRACGGDLLAPPVQVMRIINNLVSNAIEHTQHGDVLIAARRRGGMIRFEVYDTGPGMSDQQIRAYSERREKGDASDGDGLGLAICFELSSQIGSPLNIKSRLGRGTRFSLDVPAAS